MSDDIQAKETHKTTWQESKLEWTERDGNQMFLHIENKSDGYYYLTIGQGGHDDTVICELTESQLDSIFDFMVSVRRRKNLSDD
ncbi:MAG: hypothetical protein AAF126_15915 [Chloroflexota bacterium]